jgi:dGTPase
LILKNKQAKDSRFPDYQLTSAQNYKVWFQGTMIQEVLRTFKDNYQDIMNGDFGVHELLDKAENTFELKKVSKDILKDYVFPSKEVISLELVGDAVISELLDVFIKDCILTNDSYTIKSKCKSGKIFRLISDNFVYVHQLEDNVLVPNPIKKIEDLDNYSKLLLITDFISGMTDSYALDLHQKLKGVKMP